MPDGLYERDILAWSERQATLLRSVAAGERPNEDVDWANVIDEVETVGRSELRACESLVEQVFAHLAKLHREPDSTAAAHWRHEVVTFLARLRRVFTPSMRQRLDLPALYSDMRQAENAFTGGSGLPDTCPFTLDDLLATEPDLDALTARLR